MTDRPSTIQSLRFQPRAIVSRRRASYLPDEIGQAIIGYDDTGGFGPMVIAVPGVGDLLSEYRYLTAGGYRVVIADVRRHGASSLRWEDY